MVKNLLLAAWLLGPTTRAPEQAPAPSAGLEAQVTVKLDAGPLPGALDAFEKQTGVAFSVLPELLPPGLKIPALSHQGTVSAGLDKLIKPLNLRWQIGEFGGIVVLPSDLKFVDPNDWLDRNFAEEMGVEVKEVAERGQRLGFKPGDLLVALNGERMRSLSEFFRACMALERGSEVTFSVRRGQETIQVKTPLTYPGYWATYVLGLREYSDAPSPGVIYERAGHRSPTWDPAFQRLVTFSGWGLAKREPGGMLGAMRECGKAGCRDPLLLEILASNLSNCSEGLWKQVEGWVDPERLRTAYGGSMVMERALLATDFLQQGPPSIRDRCRRLVEAAWAAFRPGPKWRMRRTFGYSVAALHYLEGRFEDCVRVMKELQEQYLADSATPEELLHVQALCRLGKLDRALEEWDIYNHGNPEGRARNTRETIKETRERIAARSGVVPERFSGPAGLVGWRPFAAIDAFKDVAQGRDPTGRHEDQISVAGSNLYHAPFEPFFEDAEIHFFARMEKEFRNGEGTAGLAFGVRRDEDRKYDRFGGAYCKVLAGFRLMRIHSQRIAEPLALPGFVNDGTDTLRFFKQGDAWTIRSNGVWVTTDLSEGLSKSGSFLLEVAAMRGTVDAGILVPTARCYDNDRIRELVELVLDPRRKIAPEERLKRWDEAALLAPPKNFMREFRHHVPQGIRDKVPTPAYPADAPPLVELTQAQAAERFAQRGPVRWTKPDPEDKDALWCARPDGTLEVMSLARYWTTTHRHIRDFVGSDTPVGDPLFEKEAVWFPTNRGLFRYDRKGEVFRRVPLGGLFHDVAIKTLSRSAAGPAIETAAGEKWSLNVKTTAWSRR